MDIKKRANQIAHRFQSRNPFEIVHGLNVILVDAPLSGVRGFYQYFQRNHIIYLDETLSEQERTLVLAHELGHLFLHKKANAIFMDTRTHLKTAEYETEADTFAIELLLPDDTFSEYLSAGYPSEQISRITGYAQRLIDLKASHIKIL